MSRNWTRVVILMIILVLTFQSEVQASDKKGCQLNEVLINEEIFPNFACWKCYENFRTSGKLVKVNCRIEHDEKFYSVPGFVVGDDGCVPFDHRTKSISELVQSSLTNSTFERWSRCCNDAVECCESMIENYQVENFFNTCDSHWDGSSCFLDAFPTKIVEKSCPHQLTKDEKSKCEHFYSKECQLNGTWSATDYSNCFESKRLQSNVIWHITIISLSLVVCVPPMFIYLIEKSVRSKSLAMIVVLISIVVCRNCLTIVSKSFIHIAPEILGQHAWLCKLPTGLTHFAETFSFFYLILMASSLRLLVVGKFKSMNMAVVSLGFLFSIVTTVSWTLIMKFTLNFYCWLLDLEHPQHWVNNGPRLAMLLIAAFYFAKAFSHKNESDKMPEYSNEAKFTAKFVLVLSFPFFTVPFIVMLTQTVLGNCGNEELIKFLIISCNGLQGVSLSFLFVLHPKMRNLFRRKISSNGSKASLAPSAISRCSTRKGESPEPISSWNDLVVRARNSICEGNSYSTEPHAAAISSSPDPTKNRFSLMVQPTSFQNIQQDSKRRHTIRDIMQLAKSNTSKNPSSIPTIAKCVTPPLPKNIPNQILDDVQLFDYYYKNLNSIFIQEIPQNHHQEATIDIKSQNANRKFDDLMEVNSFKNNIVS